MYCFIAGKKEKKDKKLLAVPELGLVMGCGTVPEWKDQIRLIVSCKET